MEPAFISGAGLKINHLNAKKTTSTRQGLCPRMASDDAKQVVDTYFPVYQRYRAPTITFDGNQGISLSMKPIKAFQEIDRTDPPLFDYDDDEFKPNKPKSPSDISWPSGDGRGNKMKGVISVFTQPNLKEYGPFPDFYKRSCDG